MNDKLNTELDCLYLLGLYQVALVLVAYMQGNSKIDTFQYRFSFGYDSITFQEKEVTTPSAKYLLLVISYFSRETAFLLCNALSL